MKFGVRQCANIVFRAKNEQTIGSQLFHVGQPVLYIDSATTASLEQSTDVVYAQGGRGNVRLISWEGNKTVTFSFTDALLSPIGFGILSGAGIFKGGNDADGEAGSEKDLVHFHTASLAQMTISGSTGTIDLSKVLAEYKYGTGASAIEPKICINDAPIYVMEADADGSVTGALYSGSFGLNQDGDQITITGLKLMDQGVLSSAQMPAAVTVMVDFYVDLPGKHVWEADITGETFGGNYYVEADTLFRTTAGQDLAANLTFPNVKIQSNFTMTFASTGDPSTFDFTMDAFPDYTYFDTTKKVICVLQVLDYNKNTSSEDAHRPVMYHDGQLQHLGDDEGDIWYGNDSQPANAFSPSNVAVTVDPNGQ